MGFVSLGAKPYQDYRMTSSSIGLAKLLAPVEATAAGNTQTTRHRAAGTGNKAQATREARPATETRRPTSQQAEPHSRDPKDKDASSAGSPAPGRETPRDASADQAMPAAKGRRVRARANLLAQVDLTGLEIPAEAPAGLKASFEAIVQRLAAQPVATAQTDAVLPTGPEAGSEAISSEAAAVAAVAGTPKAVGILPAPLPKFPTVAAPASGPAPTAPAPTPTASPDPADPAAPAVSTPVVAASGIAPVLQAPAESTEEQTAQAAAFAQPRATQPAVPLTGTSSNAVPPAPQDPAQPAEGRPAPKAEPIEAGALRMAIPAARAVEQSAAADDRRPARRGERADSAPGPVRDVQGTGGQFQVVSKAPAQPAASVETWAPAAPAGPVTPAAEPHTVASTEPRAAEAILAPQAVEPAQTAPAGATAPAAAQPADPAQRMAMVDQMIEQVRLAGPRSDQQVVVNLDPPELGRVRLTFHADGQEIRGVVEADNPRTLSELQREASGLTERLAGEGIELRRLDFQLTEPGRGDGQSMSFEHGAGTGPQAGQRDAPHRDADAPPPETAVFRQADAEPDSPDGQVDEGTINVWM